MRWTERQQRMLKAIGLRPWGPPRGPGLAIDEPVGPVAASALAAVATAAAPSPVSTGPRAAAMATAVADVLAPAVQHLREATPPDERSDAIAAMDWAALHDAVSGCRACTLCDSRRHTVFGVGHPQAHWMIVGEAPGENEDLQGEPFVGAAGQLLDAMLRALALSRAAGTPASQVYIANTLKCRPPRNRNPLPDELDRCEPFLKRQIALVQPRVILAMGKFAIAQLLGTDEPVGRLRGRVHQYQGVPVVVSYHPAYLLRQPSEKAKSWEDLRLAASVYEATLSASP